MATQTESGRSLRHKARRHYDEGEHQDDEIEGKRTFTLDDKLTADHYNVPMVKKMKGEDFTLKWLQENGFDTPLIFKDSSGLGIRVPSSDFTVNDVKQFVGSRRVVDVMDVNTQKGIEMSMAQFAKYYESPDRKELYNVISLEFSHTRLADTIERPTVVRQIDWVDTVWPRHLIKTQKDSTNVLAEMKYPKVQKYCLMSVKGCYTDFHVDFGGTSVWYHILKGAKVFWLIPPTEENLETYESWVLSGKQGDIFLGDRVMECGRIRLEAGDTFMIPTGWIHAVYTPEDSLVFGGNILHTFNVRRQLRVSMVEDKTRVPVKFRYPFFFEIHWYALARYVDVLLGKSYTKKLEQPETTPTKIEKESSTNGDEVKAENGVKEEEVDVDEEGGDDEEEEGEDESKENGGSHAEVKEEYMEVTVKEEYIEVTVKEEPDDPDGTNKTEGASNHGDGESLAVAITVEIKQEDAGGGGGEATSSTEEKKHVHLCWAEMEGLINLVEFLESLPRSKRSVPELIENPDGLLEDGRLLLELHQDDDPAMGVTGQPVIKWPDPPPKLRPLKVKSGTNSNKPANKGVSSGNRKRRTRCKKCENCTRTECGKCNFCRDMKKFGGPGRMKQSCIMRQCLAPILPSKSNCYICNVEDVDTEATSNLMECYQCNEIVHPACLRGQGYTEEGVINEDLQNSWECPKCVTAAGESTDIQSEASSETTPKGRKRKNADSTTKKDVGGGGDAAGLKKERVGNKLRGAVVTSMGRSLRRGKGMGVPVTSIYQGRLRTRLHHKPANAQQLYVKQKVLKAKYRIQSSRKARGELRWRPWHGTKQHSIARPPKLEAEVEPGPVLMEKVPPCASPKFVVRPAPANPLPEFVPTRDGCEHSLNRDVWMNIFQFLDVNSLCECMAVCRTWNRWCIHPSLWRRISLARITPVSKSALCGIVRRQPMSLDLSWTNITAKQLEWVLPRLPNLRDLKLTGSTWPVVSNLASVVCPFLTSLDLQWVSALNDSSLLSLLSPPPDHRPGYFDERSRLCNLEYLCLTGADITDATMSEIVQYTPLLAHLDVSFCGNLTDASIRILLDEKSPVRMSLQILNIAGCRKLTMAVFNELESCPKLQKLVIHSCPNLTSEACPKFVEQKGVEVLRSKPRRR